MKTWLLGVAIVLSLAGCGASSTGGSGESNAAADHQAITQAFTDALFTGSYDTAKGLAPAAQAESVGTDVDAFAGLADTYEFREVSIVSTRAWAAGSGSEESDKRVEVGFQFREKNPDARWRIGSLNVRAMLVDGAWRVADLVLVRPES